MKIDLYSITTELYFTNNPPKIPVDRAVWSKKL